MDSFDKGRTHTHCGLASQLVSSLVNACPNASSNAHSTASRQFTLFLASVVCLLSHVNATTRAQDAAAPRPLAKPPITAAALTLDERFAVFGSQSGLEVCSLPDLATRRRLDSMLAHIHDVAFSPDGAYLLVAGGAPAERGVVEVWDWRKETVVRSIAAHDDLVYRVAWSPDGRRFATASADGRCRVFARDSDRAESTYEGHSRAVLTVTFLPDGDTLVSAGVDQTLQVWRRDQAQRLRTLDNHVGAINHLAVRPMTNPDERPVLASVSEDRTVRLWQPTIGRLMRFVRLESVPRVVCWSGDSTKLLIGCNDGHIRTIDADTMQVVADQSLLAGRVHELLVGTKSQRIAAAGSAVVVKARE